MATKRPATERTVLLVATLVALAGILGTAWVASTESTPDRPQVDADVSERYASMQGISGTRTTTIERAGAVTRNRTYSVHLRPATGEKRLSLVAGESRYDLRLSNGTVLWLYDRDTAIADRIRLSGGGEQRRGDRIERLFTRLDAAADDDVTPDAPPTVEPLPVVPQTRAGQPAATHAADGGPLVVTYDGVETVADRSVYVLRLTPANGTDTAAYEQTLWIDTEHFYPLKQRTAWTQDGDRTVQTTTYADVQFEPGLDDAVFTPEFPANTTVRSGESPETTTYRDVSALRDATDISIPEPRVHPSYEVAYATRTDGGLRGVGVRYTNSTSVLTVAKYNYTYPVDESAAHVEIDGQQAALTRGQKASLSWNCERYRYTVRGAGVSSSALVDVGQSIGCPGGV